MHFRVENFFASNHGCVKKQKHEVWGMVRMFFEISHNENVQTVQMLLMRSSCLDVTKVKQTPRNDLKCIVNKDSDSVSDQNNE